jgi:hypothetical protein
MSAEGRPRYAGHVLAATGGPGDPRQWPRGPCAVPKSVPRLPQRLATGINAYKINTYHELDQRAHLNRYALQHISIHMRSSRICGASGQEAR